MSVPNDRVHLISTEFVYKGSILFKNGGVLEIPLESEVFPKEDASNNMRRIDVYRAVQVTLEVDGQPEIAVTPWSFVSTTYIGGMIMSMKDFLISGLKLDESEDIGQPTHVIHFLDNNTSFPFIPDLDHHIRPMVFYSPLYQMPVE